MEGGSAVTGIINGGVVTSQSVLSEVVVTASKRVAQATALSVGGNFLKGIGKSALSTVTGVWDAVNSPIQTAKGIGNLLQQSQVITGAQIYIAGASKYNDFKKGDANTKAKIGGEVVGDIAQMFIGTQTIKTSTKVLDAAKAPSVAANTVKTSMKLLGRSVNASWGKVFNYRHGGQMSAIEHIMYRHSVNSGFTDVSKYSRGTSAKMIKGYVNLAIKYGKPIQGGFE